MKSKLIFLLYHTRLLFFGLSVSLFCCQSYGQNCLILNSQDSINIGENPYSEKFIKKINNNLSYIDFLLIETNRSSYISSLSLDSNYNYSLIFNFNGDDIKSKAGKLNDIDKTVIDSGLYLSGDFYIVCPNDYIGEPAYSILIVKYQNDVFRVSSQGQNILSVLNNHKYFFKIPIYLFKIFNEIR